MSANAYNLQWLLSGGNGFQPDTMKVFSIIRADILGWILFAGAYVLVFFTLKKESSAKSLFLCASFITFAFYMLPTQMHERYFFSFFVFFLFISPETRLQRGLYILSSALFFINVFSVFGVHRKYFCSFTEQYGTMLSVVTASLSLTIFVILAIMMAMGSFVDFKQNVHNPESSQSLYH
jgi:hypothetical protein